LSDNRVALAAQPGAQQFEINQALGTARLVPRVRF